MSDFVGFTLKVAPSKEQLEALSHGRIDYIEVQGLFVAKVPTRIIIERKEETK